MLDPTAHPHIFEAIVAASDHRIHLAMRAASRPLCDLVDAQLFRHVAADFSKRHIIFRHPTGPRLPLASPPVCPKHVDCDTFECLLDDFEALMRRWRRTLAFTHIADLHGSGSVLADWLAIVPISVPIPLVRDMRTGDGPCPFHADEWHRHLLHGTHTPILEAARLAKRIVLHTPALPGIPWISLSPLWLEAEQSPSDQRPATDLAIVLHQDQPGASGDHGPELRHLIESLCCEVEDSDTRLTFVGWEGLTEHDLRSTGFDELGVVHHGGGPLAVRAITCAMDDTFRSWGVYGGWGRDRITSCSVEEWRQASAFPNFVLHPPAPPAALPPPLAIAPPTLPNHPSPAASDSNESTFKGMPKPQHILTPAHPSKAKRLARRISIRRGRRGQKLCMVM